MAQGEFHRPLGPDEACRLLTQYDGEAHILAGGTDLMAKINRKLISPKRLIYIGDCGLDYIREDGRDLVIGGATCFSEIMRSSLVQEKAPLLAAVVKGIGSPAIRNMATIGGNLSHASPAADSAVALLALGARLKLISEKGQRLVPSEEFFTGPGET
ncbi:MAG: FAD binding domain-containing protein, partial [Pseudomonadota bacterium]